MMFSTLVNSVVLKCALEIKLAWIGIELENCNIIVCNIVPNIKIQYRFNEKFTDKDLGQCFISFTCL